MKRFVLLIFFFSLLFSSQNNLQNMSLLELFKNKYYTYICNRRWIYINKYDNKREDLLSLVAYSCLKKRFLTPALDLAKVLKATKEGRKNATYIVTLFLMKKLIIQIIEDGFNIGDIKLPKITDNDLGIVFGFIEKGSYKRVNNSLLINVSENKSYKVSISKTKDVIINVILNGKTEKREYYW